MANEYQAELDRIHQNIADTYSVLSDAGAETPSNPTTENLAETAASIAAVLYNKAQSLSDTQKSQARSNIGALAETELESAVTDALAQAKESGDFDGAPGKDGSPGADGAPGKDGRGVQSMTYNASTNKWTVAYTDGSSEEVAGPAIPDVSGYMPKSGGTFAGAVKAGSQDPGTYLLRNIKVGLTEESPTVNGELFFLCE